MVFFLKRFLKFTLLVLNKYNFKMKKINELYVYFKNMKINPQNIKVIIKM